MSIFSGSKGKDELVLVLNIESFSIGGALFYTQSSGIPKIIFSVREILPIEKAVDVDRFFTLTIQTLESVVNKIFTAGAGVPRKIFCVLSSPWYASQTRVIRLEKNTPFVFTSKLADDLIQKEIAIFEGEHLAKYGNEKTAVRSIELKNIKTILNGYETSKPINQKAKELEMTIFVSMSPENVLHNIEGAIAKHFSSKQIKYFSFVMASFAVVRDVYSKQEDFLLVNVGGEVTDISMIKKNILCESISFPLGRNFFTRGIASSLRLSFEEANSMISLFKDDHAEGSTFKKIEPVLSKLKAEWLKKFQESLANISNDIYVPAIVYIILDGDLADFFSDIIKMEQFNQYTLTESKFEVIFLGGEVFHGMAEFGDRVIRESALIIDAIYINRFLTKSTLFNK